MRRSSKVLTVLAMMVGIVLIVSAVRSATAAYTGMSMSEDWDFYPLRVDNEPASIYLNLALARLGPLSAQPHMAYVRVRMRQPRPDGLSSNEEFDALSGLEDQMVPAAAREGVTIYAGRNTSGGNRDFYFYTADPADFATAVKKAMASMPEYQFQIGGRPDPAWKVYFDFLYPSADDYQRILNRRVIDSLTHHGDDLSKPRTIDHMAYVPNMEAAKALTNYLRNQGFIVEEPRVDGSSVGVSFKRTNTPGQMDETVIPIARQVQELGGEYDGWGCEVVK